LRVGGVTLRPCRLGADVRSWCGSLLLPLDPGVSTEGRIRIGFGWFPRRDPTLPAAGTIVAQEGGPGYPATGTAPDFVDMLGSLLQRHNLLVVDARGTGRSTPIDCEPLQSLPSPAPPAQFAAAVAACGRQLNHTFPLAGGGFVHASDLFTTANTAADMADVIRALDLGKVDLYGDSYGTYFAQSFLARYPQRLRSVVLDSAYEARDLNPWYTSTVTTAQRAFDTVCQRALGCPKRGSVWRRIGQLAALLRSSPITGSAVGTGDARHRYTVDITALVNLVNDAGYDFDPYRQLDAAVRAYLYHRDASPLLRLYAQDVGYDYSDYSANASYYSDGLYMAVGCTDYPQLFSMKSTVSQRRAQLAASIAALPPKVFAPFSTAEWINVLPYTEMYTGCLTWPAPAHTSNPPVPPRVSMDATHVPVLILNGSLDSLTPARGGAHIQHQIGADAQSVVVANTVHLVALDSPHECGPLLVRHFISRPFARLNTACAARVPAVRAVPSFPRKVVAVAAARGRGPLPMRRLATIAVAEAGDALTRFNYVDGYRDLGLRGGTVRYDRAGDATLRSVRYTVDTRTTGRVFVTRVGGRGRLTVTGPRGRPTTFTFSWGRRPWAIVRTTGHRFTTPAP
jgi:pimeloyl-ACP methyl ester carboxylesterase